MHPLMHCSACPDCYKLENRPWISPFWTVWLHVFFLIVVYDLLFGLFTPIVQSCWMRCGKKQCSKVGAICYDLPANYVSFTARVVLKKKKNRQRL